MTSDRNKNTTREILRKILEEMRNLIPMIVVWGAQKAGKSSTLNKTFNIYNAVQPNKQLGTKCVIEYRYSRIYKIKRIYLKDKSGVQKDFRSVEDAEKSLTDQVFYNCEIIVESPSKDNECVVTDIPGCNDESDTYHRDKSTIYLKPAQAIIVHVASAQTPPQTDISLKPIGETMAEAIQNERYVQVITNADAFAGDRVDWLNHYNNKTYPVVLLENKTENGKSKSDELFTRLGFLHQGHEALRNILYDMQYKAVRRMLQPIRNCAKELKEVAESELKDIKRESFDSGKVFVQFIKEMATKLQMDFNNIEFAEELNNLSSCFAIQNLQNLCEHMQTVEEIGNEMRNSIIDGFPPAAGWNNIAIRNFQKMTNFAKNQVRVFVNKFFDVISNQLKITFTKLICPATEKVQKKIMQECQSLVKNEKKTCIFEIERTMDQYVIQPNFQGIQELMSENYVNAIEIGGRQLLLYIRKHCQNDPQQMSNIINGFLNDTTGTLIKNQIRETIGDNYSVTAQNAHVLMKVFWKQLLSQQIHRDVTRVIGLFRREIVSVVQEMINKSAETDIEEPAGVQDMRQLLLSLENSCEMIEIMDLE